MSNAALPPTSITLLVDPPNEAHLIQDDDSTIVEILSPRGVGKIEIQFDHAEPPKRLTLRFHLSGLEQLRLSTSTANVSASLSPLDPTVTLQEIATVSGANSQAAALEPMTAEHVYWLSIQTQPTLAKSEDTSQTDKPNSPEQTAIEYIDVMVPQAFIRDAGGQVSVEWIDFYR